MRPCSSFTFVEIAVGRRDRGFTLIEIAVVVALIGIMLTAGLKIASSLLENAAYNATLKKEQAIKESLIGFLGRYHRLPCPDTSQGSGTTVGFSNGATPPDGVENTVGVAGASDCASPYGVLPYVTLGLPRDAALDGWQNYFSYQVPVTGPTTFAWNKATATSYPESNLQYTTYSASQGYGIPIKNDDHNGNVTLLPAAIAVVTSYGANGAGAFTVTGTQIPAATTTDEAQNAVTLTGPTLGWITGATPGAVPAFYYSGQQNDNQGATNGPFDHLVLAVNMNDLLNPLYQNAILQPPQAYVGQQLTTLRNAMLAYLVTLMAGTTCPVPTGITLPAAFLASYPSLPATDPWGQQWTYGAFAGATNEFDHTKTGRYIVIGSSGPLNLNQSITTYIFDSDFAAYISQPTYSTKCS